MEQAAGGRGRHWQASMVDSVPAESLCGNLLAESRSKSWEFYT